MHSSAASEQDCTQVQHVRKSREWTRTHTSAKCMKAQKVSKQALQRRMYASAKGEQECTQLQNAHNCNKSTRTYASAEWIQVHDARKCRGWTRMHPKVLNACKCRERTRMHPRTEYTQMPRVSKKTHVSVNALACRRAQEAMEGLPQRDQNHQCKE
eukprot:1143010-Pelagomonas_calceolata.AAC.4